MTNWDDTRVASGFAAGLRVAAGALAVWCAMLYASVTSAAADPRNPSALTLTGPSVVIVHASPAELREEKEKARSEEEFAEVNKDFQNTTTAFVKAMQAYPNVKVTTSAADVIRFSEPNVPPVWRYSVGTRTAFVFYRPGKPVRVFSGVRSADGLVCEAARLFDLKPRPPRCDV
jgi:hypothetical protein